MAQLVSECRTDASKFFFPSPDFNPSPAPAMLSCAALDSSEPRSLPRLPMQIAGLGSGAGGYRSVRCGDHNHNPAPPAGHRNETKDELSTEQGGAQSSSAGAGGSWAPTSGHAKNAGSKSRARQNGDG
ncbi:unnamed protein product, partial [Laminaria digitata]